MTAAVDPDVIQFNGAESKRPSPARDDAPGAPSTCPRPATAATDPAWRRARACLAGGVDRLLLDTAGGPHPGGTGIRADAAAAVGDRPGRAGHPGRWADRQRTWRGPCATSRRSASTWHRAWSGPRERGERPSQGSVPRGPVRETREGRARRPAQRGLRADAGPRRPAGGGRRRVAGGWSATSADGTCPRR